MMDSIYREQILELYKHPHNQGELKERTHSHREFNPLCGDDITMDAVMKEGKVEEIRFHGHGCALSTASASLITDKVKGMKKEDILKLTKEDVLEMLGIPVGPVRLKCALLPLETLQKLVMDNAGD